MHHLTRPVAVICMAVASTFAQAQEAAYDFNIPAQPVSQVLEALTAQAGLKPFYADDSVKGASSPGVKGHYTLQEALGKALAGTGLQGQFTSDKAVAIKSMPMKAQTPVTLDEVTVIATRTERPVDEVPASVTVLTAKKLKTKNRQNVYEALRDEVGLDFNYPTSVAHQVDPAIRGVTGSFAGPTTLTLVDGMPSDAASSNVIGHGGLNFTAMQDVERVEVLRGPASALYGYGAIGGVINVIPKRWKGKSGAEVNASYGSHNTQQLGAAVGTAQDNFDVRLSVYDGKSDGYVAQPIPDAFGAMDGGPRNWADKKVALMAGFRPADQHEITLNVQTYDTDSAIYGGRPNDRQKMNGQSATLGYRFDVSDSTNIQTKFKAAHLRQFFSFDNGDWNGLAVPGQVTAADIPLAYYGGRTSDTTKFLAQLDTKLTESNQLIVGYGHDTADYQTDSTTVGVATSYTDAKDKADALFMQDEQKIGALTLTGGLRYDRLNFAPDTVNGVPKNGSSSTDNIYTPRLGARYHLTESTSFYASYGTGYLPALNQYKYVQPSTTRVDNPNIKPERSATYELGMNNDLGFGKIRTSVFQTKYQDKITLGTDPVTAKRQWQNIAYVKVDGIEIAFDGNFGRGWQPYANFSYTKARDYATAVAVGTQSTRIAPRKFNLGVTYAPGDAWSVTLNGRVVSDMYYNNLTAAQHQGGYFIADAKVNMALPLGDGEKWSAFFAVNNIGGKKYQPFNIGEWSDGRTATLGLNGKL